MQSKGLILVTGGCGYIGSHTIVDLIDNGYTAISIDNLSRSDASVLAGVKNITGVEIKNYRTDLCNFEDTRAVFAENPNIKGIIHFAAFKAVGESVKDPLLYYHNNLASLTNVLRCAEEFGIPHFVFSSSCTVYGNPATLPVTEESPLLPAQSPYGATKQMGETIVETAISASTNMNAVLLRYFNPVGAHPSCSIGEMPIGQPQNLVPVITQTAIGKMPAMKVWGDDYDTKDGSCVRDYIHVCDIAHAHTLALEWLEKQPQNGTKVFNLGSGTGYSVLEMIKKFEDVAAQKLNYSIGPRRPGDVVAIFANNDLAKRELGWQDKFSADEMLATAWAWEKRLQHENPMLKNPGLN